MSHLKNVAFVNKVSLDHIKRNRFDLSHEVKTTVMPGRLVPILTLEVVPGDDFSIATELIIETMPQIAPTKHRVEASVHYFYSPNYLVHANFIDWLTGGVRGDGKVTNEDGSAGTVDLAVPSLSMSTWYTETTGTEAYRRIFFGPSTLWNYLTGTCLFGRKRHSDGSYYNVNYPRELTVNMLAFRHYQRIWAEHYRDQNLTDDTSNYRTDTLNRREYVETAPSVNGVLDPINEKNIFALRNRCWERDLLTAALPWTQRGTAPAVPLSSPTNLFADVLLNVTPGSSGEFVTTSQIPGNAAPGYSLVTANDPNITAPGLPLDLRTGFLQTGGGSAPGQWKTAYDPNGTLVANLGNLDFGSMSINEFRYAVAVQRTLESLARIGGRPHEAQLAIYGVNSSYTQYYKPVCFGGGTMQLQMDTQYQTNNTSSELTPQGNPSGNSMTYQPGGIRGNHYVHDNGYIFAILSIRPCTAYADGIPRHFLKTDKYDYLHPQLQNIGEVPVYYAEAFAPEDSTLTYKPYDTWGYHRPYYEYAIVNSTTTGQLAATLAHWTQTRFFSQNNPPALNSKFVTMDGTSDEMTRPFAYTGNDPYGTDKYVVMAYHKIFATRPLDVLGEPGLDRI